MKKPRRCSSLSGPRPSVAFMWVKSNSVVSWDTSTQACPAQRFTVACPCGMSSAPGAKSSQLSRRKAAMVSPHPPLAAEMLAAGDLAKAAATLPKRRLRLTSLRSALANSSVKSSGMGAVGHADPSKQPFLTCTGDSPEFPKPSGDPAKPPGLCIKIRAYGTG